MFNVYAFWWPTHSFNFVFKSKDEQLVPLYVAVEFLLVSFEFQIFYSIFYWCYNSIELFSCTHRKRGIVGMSIYYFSIWDFHWQQMIGCSVIFPEASLLLYLEFSLTASAWMFNNLSWIPLAHDNDRWQAFQVCSQYNCETTWKCTIKWFYNCLFFLVVSFPKK